MTAYAQRRAVEKAAEKWGDNVIECRSYGHAWTPYSVAQHKGGYAIAQVCSRGCGCGRVRWMDKRGYPDRWRMTYPGDYLLKGLGRIDRAGRAALALASIRNATILDAP